MSASKADIEGWLAIAKERGATHLIVACHRFDYENYPVYVMPGEDPYERQRQLGEMRYADEVYSMRLDLAMQLREHRAFHYD